MLFLDKNQNFGIRCIQHEIILHKFNLFDILGRLWWSCDSKRKNYSNCF